MESRALGYALTAVAVVALLGYLGVATGALLPVMGGYDPANPDGYEHATVTVSDAETGERLGTVEAAVADGWRTRYVGLSNTDALPEDRGMLFVHDDADRRTYVMRSMDFGLDIVFVAPNGTITAIHEAPAPGPDEDGSEQQYAGQGTYVLEVNLGWTAERGVEAGDEVTVER
jgi:uncharacterized membrane protein (UPF0127 family)